jgi:cell division protein FtsN
MRLVRRFVIFTYLTFLLTSCSLPDQQQEVRIVDLQGRPSKRVITRTPELNSQILAQQNNQSGQNYRLASNDVPAPSPIERVSPGSGEVADVSYRAANNPNNFQSFGSASSQAISETLQVPTAAGPSQQKVNQIFKKTEPPVPASDSITKAGVDEKDKDQVIEYDLTAEEDSDAVVTSAKSSFNNKKVIILEDKKAKKSAAKKSGSSDKKASSGKFFVQVGSFAEEANANKSLAEMKKFHSGSVRTVNAKNGIKHRVVLGPFVKESDAKKLISKLQNSGHEAVLTK